MMLAVCPNCRRRLKVNAGSPDRVLTCPACGVKFQVQLTATATVLPVVPAAPLPVAPAEWPIPLTPAQDVPPSAQATVLPGRSGVSPLPLAPAPAAPVPAPLPVAAPLPPRPASPVRMATPVGRRPDRPSADDDEPAPPIPKRRKDDDGDDRPGHRSQSSRRSEEDPPKKRGGMLFVLVGGGCLALAVVAVAVVAFTAFKKADDGKQPTAGKSLGKYGGIEIGAKGIKSVVVDFTAADGGGYAFTLPLEKEDNVGLATLPAGSTDFDPAALDQAQSVVQRMYEQMTKEHGLTADHIFVIASSGVFAPFKDNPAAGERNAAELARRVKVACGEDLDRVTEQDEGRYSILACVPSRELTTTLLLDIGGGNTKGGCFNSSGSFTPLAVKTGVSTYTKDVEANAKEPPGRRLSPAQLRQKVLIRPLHDQTERQPGLLVPRRVYLNGGITWAMTTYTHPAEQDKMRVGVKAADIDTFRKMLARSDQEAVRREVLASVPQTTDEGKAAAKQVEADLAKLSTIYTPQQLTHGTDILQAVADEFHLADKEVVFFRKGQYIFVMGYIVEKAEIEKKAAAK